IHTARCIKQCDLGEDICERGQQADGNQHPPEGKLPNSVKERPASQRFAECGTHGTTLTFFFVTFDLVCLPDGTEVFAFFARTKFLSGGSRRAIKDVAAVVDNPAISFGMANFTLSAHFVYPTLSPNVVYDSRQKKGGN
ncbi:MAG: hypothetical protein WAU74_16265, partial [Pseudolabrys sp.]